MFRGTIRTAVLAVALLSGPVFGQNATLVPVHDAPDHGADIATFHRDFSHYTFDLRINTASSGWTASAITVEIVGVGRIWHASDQRMGGVPSTNLLTPQLDPNSTDTRVFDTFVSTPGHDFFRDPRFVPCDWIVSDEHEIYCESRHGPRDLVWMNPDKFTGSFVGVRLTFAVIEPYNDLSLDSAGRAPFATLHGFTATTANPSGAPFSFTIYQHVDCDSAAHPDDPDCNANGIRDLCDLASGVSNDCNQNGIPDECDIASGVSLDCNANGIPDECEIGGALDCNANGQSDLCDLFFDISQDCNHNRIPDECELDCNGNGIPDQCDLYPGGPSQDCNGNHVPDDCDIANGFSLDCNGNAVPDDCDIQFSFQPDCNANGIPDDCDIAAGTEQDCDGNGWPDSCGTVFPPHFNLRGAENGVNGFAVIGFYNLEGLGNTARAGDINGDGFDDLAISRIHAHWCNDDHACIMLGGPHAGEIGLIRFDEINGSNGFYIRDILCPFDERWVAQIYVSGCGDVNGDGLDDLLIGASLVSGQYWPGQAFVVFGSPTLGADGSVSLRDLDGINGFVIQAFNASTSFGTSVAGAGDVNGDGIADLLIGDPGFDTARRTGRAFVVYGAANLGAGGQLDLATVNGSNGFVMRNDISMTRVGICVTSAGDMNQDGYGDIIVGASGGDTGFVIPGNAYVVLGGPSVAPTGELDLRTLNGTNGFRIRNDATDGHFGHRVAGIGDVDADGFDDVMISKGIASDAYVIRGTLSFPAEISIQQLDGHNGFRIGDDSYAKAVGSAGDLNHDGIDDLLVGVPGNGYDLLPGSGYVLFGRRGLGASGHISLSGLTGRDGFQLESGMHLGGGGSQVGRIGRMNADHYDDVFITAPNQSYPVLRDGQGYGMQTGAVYVFFGRHAPQDCNANSIPDWCDIDAGLLPDTNHNHTADTCECPTDLNRDGVTDISDLQTLLAHFGRVGDATRGHGDIDEDRNIDLNDLTLMLSRFGSNCP